jgi:hypothetical protein
MKPGSYRNNTAKVHVEMPEIARLGLSGASTGSIKGFKSNRALYLNLSGASRLTGQVESGDVRLVISGASTVALSGKAGNLRLDVSGASTANLQDLSVQDVSATVSGASNGTVSPSGRLDANASGASRLTYIGNPAIGSINSSGASSVGRKYTKGAIWISSSSL